MSPCLPIIFLVTPVSLWTLDFPNPPRLGLGKLLSGQVLPRNQVPPTPLFSPFPTIRQSNSSLQKAGTPNQRSVHRCGRNEQRNWAIVLIETAKGRLFGATRLYMVGSPQVTWQTSLPQRLSPVPAILPSQLGNLSSQCRAWGTTILTQRQVVSGKGHSDFPNPDACLYRVPSRSVLGHTQGGRKSLLGLCKMPSWIPEFIRKSGTGWYVAYQARAENTGHRATYCP